MDEEDILQLVADGELDPSEAEDFAELEDEVQDLVLSGELDIDEAMEI
jgi:hypothetical protein